MQMRQTYLSIEIKNRYNDRLIIFRNCGNLNTHVIRMNVMIHVSDIWNAKQILYSNFTSIIAFVKFLNLHQHPRIILISKKKKKKKLSSNELKVYPLESSIEMKLTKLLSLKTYQPRKLGKHKNPVKETTGKRKSGEKSLFAKSRSRSQLTNNHFSAKSKIDRSRDYLSRRWKVSFRKR